MLKKLIAIFLFALLIQIANFPVMAGYSCPVPVSLTCDPTPVSTGYAKLDECPSWCGKIARIERYRCVTSTGRVVYRSVAYCCSL